MVIIFPLLTFIAWNFHEGCYKYAYIKGINFKETFAPGARLEAIRTFLAFSIHKNIKVYQMVMTFLNGDLEEEVYIE